MPSAPLWCLLVSFSALFVIAVLLSRDTGAVEKKKPRQIFFGNAGAFSFVGLHTGLVYSQPIPCGRTVSAKASCLCSVAGKLSGRDRNVVDMPEKNFFGF